jgi:hypothetical protein
VTGNVLDDDIKHFLLSGVDAVLLKPLRIAEMELIFSHFENHGLCSDPEIKFSIIGDTLTAVSAIDIIE